MKNPLTPAGIEPATFRFVAQHLNHCATAVPELIYIYIYIYIHTHTHTHTHTQRVPIDIYIYISVLSCLGSGNISVIIVFMFFIYIYMFVQSFTVTDWSHIITPSINTSLMTQQTAVTHTLRQTEIPALPDSSVTNTPSIKLLCPQQNCLSAYFRKKTITCLSVCLLRVKLMRLL